MEIICGKKEISNAINIVLKAVPTKSAMAVMECILIEASGDTISLMSNNMEMGIKTDVDGMIFAPGSAALDAKIFSEIVRKLPDEDVCIAVDDAFTATITCGKSKFNIPGKDSREFSRLPEVMRDNGFTIPQFKLKDIVRQTNFAVADNNINKSMTGELFEIIGDKLRVTALDGHRIAIRQTELGKTCEGTKIIVPGKVLQEVNKIISGTSAEDVTIYATKNHILFEFGSTTIVSRLIEGTYFDVNRVLSNSHETKVIIKRDDLIESLDRSTLMVREGDRKPVIVDISDESMHIQITSGIGSMNEEVEIEKVGADIRAGFNPRFVIDALKAINEEYVTLYMSGGRAPCLIKDDEGAYVYLILPISI